MCPNGLIIAFSQTAHIVPSSQRPPHILSKTDLHCHCSYYSTYAARAQDAQFNVENMAAKIIKPH